MNNVYTMKTRFRMLTRFQAYTTRSCTIGVVRLQFDFSYCRPHAFNFVVNNDMHFKRLPSFMVWNSISTRGYAMSYDMESHPSSSNTTATTTCTIIWCSSPTSIAKGLYARKAWLIGGCASFWRSIATSPSSNPKHEQSVWRTHEMQGERNADLRFVAKREEYHLMEDKF